MQEEISVSIEFDLPLTIGLALNIRGGWDQRAVRCALDVLRVADLVTRPSPEELHVALSNTTAADARAVEERLREVVPEAAFGVATYLRCCDLPSVLRPIIGKAIRSRTCSNARIAAR